MSTKKTNKTADPIYVTRTTTVPLTENELFARMQELPLVISQQDHLEMRRKDLLAELKAEAQELVEKISTLTSEINRKERTEDLRCLKHPVLSDRAWHVMHPMTGEIMEKIPMGWEEHERLKNAAQGAEAEATADKQLDLPLSEAGPIVTPPQPELLALPAMPVIVPPVGEELPLLEAAHVDGDVIEGEVVIEPGCYLGYSPGRFCWPAESTMGLFFHALHRYADGEGGLSENLVEPHFWSAPGDIPTDAQLLEYLAEAWGSKDITHASDNKFAARLVATWNGKEFRVRLSANLFDDDGNSTGSVSFARSGAELAAAIRGLLFAPVAEEVVQAEDSLFERVERDRRIAKADVGGEREFTDKEWEESAKPASGDEDLTQYLIPLVLTEEPRKNEYGTVSSVCTTLDQMIADLADLKSDERHAGHYAFSVAALKAGLGFMFIRQWSGQKSAWTQAINLANTITGDYHTDFPKALELLPAFAAHLEATKTAKNPKAGLKSWNPKQDAIELEKAKQLGNDAIGALFPPAQGVSGLTDDMVGKLV